MGNLAEPQFTCLKSGCTAHLRRCWPRAVAAGCEWKVSCRVMATGGAWHPAEGQRGSPEARVLFYPRGTELHVRKCTLGVRDRQRRVCHRGWTRPLWVGSGAEELLRSREVRAQVVVLGQAQSLPAPGPVVWAGPGTGGGRPGPRAGSVMTWCDLGQGVIPGRQPGSGGLQPGPQCGDAAAEGARLSRRVAGECVSRGAVLSPGWALLAPGWVPAVARPA